MRQGRHGRLANAESSPRSIRFGESSTEAVLDAIVVEPPGYENARGSVISRNSSVSVLHLPPEVPHLQAAVIHPPTE